MMAVVPGRFAIVDNVSREAQFVFRGGTGPDAREREPVELQPLLDRGILDVLVAEEERTLVTFIDLAQHIDEGKAMTGALAIHLRCVVVTDDKKAVRVLTEHGVPIRSTLDILKQWGELEHVDAITLSKVLKDLRQRGHYEPARTHPLRTWWDDALAVR